MHREIIREVGVLSSHLFLVIEHSRSTSLYDYSPESSSQNGDDQLLVNYPGRPHASTDIEPDAEGRAAHDCYHGITIYRQVTMSFWG